MMNELVPYHVILSAKNGDAKAIERILDHYAPLIAKYATRRTFDEYGNVYRLVDEDMKTQIADEIIFQLIYHFDTTQLPHGEELED